jgi:allantoicase
MSVFKPARLQGHQRPLTRRLTIHPDGGVKRVRVIGSKNPTQNGFIPPVDEATLPVEPSKATGAASSGFDTVELTALPLTPEAFASYGKVVQGYADPDAVPRGTKVTHANQGSATKFHKLSLLESSYLPDSGATAGLSVFRCNPIDARLGGKWDVKLLERHLHTNQAFIPMAGGNIADSGEGLKEYARAYLVIVAKNGDNDKPDLGTMRAFLASVAQGIVYDTGIWREYTSIVLR